TPSSSWRATSPRPSPLLLDSPDGVEVWAVGDGAPSYSSPFLATLGGVKQIVQFHQASVAGYALDGSRVLWSSPWSGDQPNVAKPVVLDGSTVMVSSGYGIGAAALRVATPDDGDSWTVAEAWRSPRLKAKFTNPVLHDGAVYGLDDGVLTAIDPATGDRHWKRGRYGHGQTLLVGDLLMVLAENGDAILLDPTPEESRELTRHRVLDGKAWNPPAIAGGRLFVRSADEATAYALPTTAS
ncbi:MAG: PQQ-binding-like beta-propeller repeat protein, partial [Acidobacteriota bacterium]